MFLEEQISELYGYGSAPSKSHAVDVTVAAGGSEYRRLNYPDPQLRIMLDFSSSLEDFYYDELDDLYNRTSGIFGGFRWKNIADYSTSGRKGVPTYDDQLLVADGAAWQLMKWYGVEGASTASQRRLRKPVAGTVEVGINDGTRTVEITNTGKTRWAVDATTGLVTFAANETFAITNITQAAQAVLTIGAHTLIVGDSVHVSGVVGMTEINGLRGNVTNISATTVTVDIDSTLFTAYTSGGEVNTAPQTGETVRGGCEFDIPVRFAADLDPTWATRSGGQLVITEAVELVELLSP